MTLIDGLIIVVYLTGIVVVGILYRGKQDDIRDYFTASRSFRGRVGMIVVGLSIGATLFSGLSFVAYPSIVFTHGITVLSGAVGFPAAYLIMRFWFLPRYFASSPANPYEIIERQLGKPVRLVASGMFVLLRAVWMAALIYAPVIVVMAMGGLGDEWFWPVVALIGVSSTVYTVVGGIRGVIIADALQFLLILAVLAATICYIVFRLPLSLGEIAADLRANTTLLHLNWSMDPTLTMTVMAMAVGAFMKNLSAYTSDQMSLQRYLAAGDVRSASRAFGTTMLSTVVIFILLSLVGLSIRVWYGLNHDETLPTNADKIFPHFVATQLPVGFCGMVIAGLLAATMSSMTSGINSLSGSLLNDFAPLSERVSPRRLLKIARWTSAGIGLAATLCAGFVARFGSLFNAMQILWGVFLGPLLGCMICAIIKLRISGPVMIFAMVTGFAGGVWISHSPLSSLWVSGGSSVLTLLVAWIGSRSWWSARTEVVSHSGRPGS